MSGIVVKIDGVTLTAPAWLVKPAGDLDLGTAADGSGTTGSLLIDDKDGTRRIRGWQKIEIDEPACTLANNGLMDAPRLFTGYAGRRTYSRGPYKDGPGRYILVELLDLNILLTTRLITGGDAMRPAETDIARLAWLIGSDYLDGLVQDLGLVNGTGLLFDADNTHGQYPMQVLQDLTSTYDQLFFVYYDQAAEAAGLFFDFPNAITNTSPLSISNVLSDYDASEVWLPHLDGALDADPAEVWSNIRGVYSGGVIYLTRQSTADEFFTDNDLLRRGTQVEWPKIGKAATALAFGGRFLDAAANERLSITCTVRLPATHVNLLDAGMRIPVKFTHLPDYGFDDFTYMRVQNRQVTQLDAFSTQAGELDRWYDVKVTLALTGLTTVGSGGGGGDGTGVVPQQPPAAEFVQHVWETGTNFAWDFPVTVGHLLTVYVASRTGPSGQPGSGSGWTHDAAIRVANEFGAATTYGDLYHKIADSAEVAAPTFVNPGTVTDAWEWADGVTWDTFVSQTMLPPATGVNAGGTIATGGAGAFVIGAVSVGQFGTPADYHITHNVGVIVDPATDDGDGMNFNNSGDFPNLWVGWKHDQSGNITIGGVMDGFSGAGHDNWAGVTYSVLAGGGAVEPPAHGTWSAWQVITLTGGTDGDLGFAYASGSLQIKVDGVLISPASYDEDNTAGTFTLHWTPASDEVVTARAQGI